MSADMRESVKVAVEWDRAKTVRCQGELLPRIRTTILKLKNLDNEYEDFEDDLEWLEENTAPAKERQVAWDSYLEHVWPNREDDFEESAQAEIDALEILQWRIGRVCDLVDGIVVVHGNDVAKYSESEKHIVSSLELCVMLLKTIVETPIEDTNGYFEGKVPTWIQLVRHVALTLPMSL